MIKDYRVYISTLHAGDAIDFLREKLTATCSGSSLPIGAKELMDNIQDKDAVMSVIQDRFDDAVFRACPQLKVVANVAVGHDNIDIEAATKHGVLICNTPGVLDNTTADMAFALLMAVSRRLVEADEYVRAGKWKSWSFDLLLGTDVTGKTLGIIGLGRIGQAMARRASGFDMKVFYSQRNRLPLAKEQALNVEYVPLDDLLKRSDFVSVHCPLTAQTRHLLGEREFGLMKPSAYLINTARGAIVDQPALIKALSNGDIKGAGLDVFAKEPEVPQELMKMNNVVLAPHIGSASVETRSAMARLAAEGIVSALEGKLPVNAVNPDVWPQFVKRLHSCSTR